jgi:polysaccharide export outer membrane protein
MKKTVVFVLTFFVLLSCASKKKVVYLQDIDQTKSYDSSTLYEPKLQPDDLLSIIVSAENPELTVPFNLPQIQGNYEINNNQNGIKTYLVDNFGFIEFPVIGKLKLGGLTRTEATAKLVAAVSEYIKNPIVNLRILNFKVSILGEVLKPSSFTLNSERITLLEAISMAGDLTIHGKRNNILIIREAEGKKTYNRIDITKSDFLNSPFYYLAQNDIVVVEPNKTRVNASGVGPNVTATISAISVLVTLMVVLLR